MPSRSRRAQRVLIQENMPQRPGELHLHEQGAGEGQNVDILNAGHQLHDDPAHYQNVWAFGQNKQEAILKHSIFARHEPAGGEDAQASAHGGQDRARAQKTQFGYPGALRRLWGAGLARAVPSEAVRWPGDIWAKAVQGVKRLPLRAGALNQGIGDHQPRHPQVRGGSQ